MRGIKQPINQMDKRGNILKTYNSIAEAEENTDIYQTNIAKCCQGLRKTAGKFKWGYAEEPKC